MFEKVIETFNFRLLSTTNFVFGTQNITVINIFHWAPYFFWFYWKFISVDAVFLKKRKMKSFLIWQLSFQTENIKEKWWKFLPATSVSTIATEHSFGVSILFLSNYSDQGLVCSSQSEINIAANISKIAMLNLTI